MTQPDSKPEAKPDSKVITLETEDKPKKHEPKTYQDLAEVATWAAKWKRKTAEEQKEDTRTSLGATIVNTFALMVIAVTATACAIAAFSDISRLAALKDYMQVAGTIITPILGFVVGHYFANNKNN